MTIYETILSFFILNPSIPYTRKQIYKVFKNINQSSIHTTIGSLARDKKIISINPKKWKLNEETQ